MRTPRPRFLTALAAASLLLAGLVVPSHATTTPVAVPASAPAIALAKTGVAKVKTTANLNMRKGGSTTHAVVRTIPKNTTVPVSQQAANGWYKVSYKKKTGWISNKYAKVVSRHPASKSKPGPSKKINLWVNATAAVNIRKGAGTSHQAIGTLPKNAAAKAAARASNGWYKITYKKKTGWVSNKHVQTCSRGCQVDTGAYTTNRDGLNDRYFTQSAGADLYAAAGKRLRIGDIPKNSIAYRDLQWEKAGGQVAGWYFVRTQGMDGWMKASALTRKSTAPTSNKKNYTRKQVAKKSNGRLPESMLAAIPWDTEKTLIAAPALADLTRLNTAFKKKFGKNLDIDLAYRTLDTQKYYYKELGPYIAAKPGTSNHGWGLAIDVPESHAYSFRGKYYKWLKSNSKKHNWVHRKNLEEFRADGSRNPYAEAWHFEYTGR
ncbi:SH3 domain-containing protein [Glutamicibacter arilaitensis]|uniref:SH3 domain-containing protein n=1 Tax=Glutamicibacter arilaitensis TaxID=256701 RepID=UPI003A90280E